MDNESQDITWEEIQRAMINIAGHFRNSIKQYTQIIPVARGGFVPATILSHMLELPIKDAIFAQSYTGKTQGQLNVVIPLLKDSGVGAIFVDDIIDTGNTIRAIRDTLPSAKFVAPVGKIPGVESVADHLLCLPPILAEQGVWLNFPWE